MHRTNLMNRKTIISMSCLAGMAASLACIGGWGPTPGQRGKLQFSQTQMYIEYNATAGDIGVQVMLDGEPWKKLRVYKPNGRQILDMGGTNAFAKQGFTELFFESSEPPLSELPLAEFFRRFPAGVYEFEGITIEGEEIDGEAIFTHAIPEEPVVLAPAEGSVQDPEDTEVAWLPVPNPPGSKITAYQVTVTQILAVLPKRVFSVHVPANVLDVDVPEEFLQRGANYEFEVLAIEAGGNQTIHAGTFSTAP